MKQVFIKTFGCQMNEHDSEKMFAMLQQEGYVSTSSAEEADLIVVNTCSIREKAYHKAVSDLGQRGQLKKNSEKKPFIAVTGCVVSHDGDNLLKRFPWVDVALGPDHLSLLPQVIREKSEARGRRAYTDFQDLSEYEFPTPILGAEKGARAKAYVTIMKGCDNRCSFCIVPFTRGPEVSRPPEQIIEEVQHLQKEGVREVMLLGQNVNSYGKGLSPCRTFAELLRMIDEQTSLARIRYTSPHPKDLSQSLIEEYGRNKKLCPHIHLPVQSGSNTVLKRMRRSYTREVYLRKIEKLRKRIPDIAITTDFIAGFPGETRENFEETLSLMREVGFDASYSFAFSRRPGTEAASFDDTLSEELKKERLKELQVLQAEISQKIYQACIGRTEEVLVEGFSLEGEGKAESQLTGRSLHGRMVNFNGDKSLAGAILKVKITAASAYCLRGEKVLC